jgi:probable HAF family extracellular repeat protein
MHPSKVPGTFALGSLILLGLAGCQGETAITEAAPGNPATPFAGPAATIAIQDLGTLGGTSSEAFDINANGQVTGYAFNAAEKSRVFIWDAINGMQDIGLPHGGIGTAINSAGEIAGFLTPGARIRAFLWSPVTGLRLLPFVPGNHTNTEATDVNDAGVVVGRGVSWQRRTRAFQWSASAGMTLLPLLPGSTNNQAFAINASGWIVGSSYGFANQRTRQSATLWRPGQPPTNLDALLPAGSGSFALGINDAGDISGLRIVDGPVRAIVWPVGTGTFVDIGGSTATSRAEDINDVGQVVGRALNQGTRGFLWDAVNGMQDLGALPPSNTSQAVAINNAGQIVGFSFLTAPDRHAVLWQ